MTNKQQNKLKMAEAVQQFFIDESSVFSTNIPLQECTTSFQKLVQQLQDYAVIQATDTTAHTEIKDINRDSLIKHLVVYANSASVYFSGKNSSLAKQLKISKSKLVRQTGVELKALSTNIYDILNENINLLDPQYLTSQDLNTLLEKINLFNAKAYDISIAKGDTQNATKLIKGNLKNIGIELEKIDQLMLKFTITNEDLYSRYRIARKTLDLGKNKVSKNTSPSN